MQMCINMHGLEFLGGRLFLERLRYYACIIPIKKKPPIEFTEEGIEFSGEGIEFSGEGIELRGGIKPRKGH